MANSSRLSEFTRRQWLKLAAAGVGLTSASGWIEALAAETAKDPRRKRSCILLWMNGGPSHLDTFDLKPEAKKEFRGEFKPIDTAVPGLRISEHLPKLAGQAKDLAVV